MKLTIYSYITYKGCSLVKLQQEFEANECFVNAYNNSKHHNIQIFLQAFTQFNSQIIERQFSEINIDDLVEKRESFIQDFTKGVLLKLNKPASGNYIDKELEFLTKQLGELNSSLSLEISETNQTTSDVTESVPPMGEDTNMQDHHDGSIEAVAKIQEMIQNLAPEFVVTRPIIALEEKTAFMYDDKTLVNALINGYNFNQINDEKVEIAADEIEITEEEIVEEVIPNLLTEAQDLGLLDEEEFFNVEEAPTNLKIISFIDYVTTNDSNYNNNQVDHVKDFIDPLLGTVDFLYHIGINKNILV
ncbi:hypothetical protein [Rickettsia endosymbiont of Gonocerus acuteangulatus]|uniref:hypothetical protein n=1 Tax=Rickettsia endosymbiont of Gonocerus acuteangulatus TaxID=3066266 RepID=UPI003132ED38